MSSKTRYKASILHPITPARSGTRMHNVARLCRAGIRSCSALALTLVLFTSGCTDSSPREGDAAALEAHFNEEVLPSLQEAKHGCQGISSAITRLDEWVGRVESAGLEKEFTRELREARALALEHVARCWKQASEPCVDPTNPAQMTSLRALSESAVALGAATHDYDPDDPRLRCKAARIADRGPATDCPAVDVKAWRATLRYSADLASVTSTQRLERQLILQLDADMPGTRGPNGAAFESWTPRGKAAVHLSSYQNGKLRYEATAEGSPVPGDRSVVKDSRILMSISSHDCSYNFYSSGTVVGEASWHNPESPTETVPIAYGTLTVREQPITGKRLSGSATLPTVSDSDITNNAIPKPNAFFHDIQTGSGSVQVHWEFVPIE